MNARDRIVLNHLVRMTDSTGLVQHAIYSIPRRESGYLRTCPVLRGGDANRR